MRIDRLDLEPPADSDPPVGPPVTLSLPDDQQLNARLLRRFRDTTGSWWADVSVTLWGRLDLPTGHAGVEPARVDLTVPMDLLTPVPGQEAAYATVHTVDMTVPRPWAIVWAELPPDEGSRGVLHRRDCGRAHRARTAEALTDVDVRREVLSGWGRDGLAIGYCPVCRPQNAPEMRRLVGRAATTPERSGPAPE